MPVRDFQLGRAVVGPARPTYFVADIAANHDGDLERAKHLIDLAAEAGADAAKFQNFRAPRHRESPGVRGARRAEEPPVEVAQVGLRDLPGREHSAGLDPELSARAKAAGIDYFTSPYDFESVDAVDPYVPAYKIGSGDITWTEIVEKIASKGKPVLLACGASTADDVRRAMDVLLARTTDVVLMQCNTNYTGSLENLRHVHLNVLKTFAAMYPDVLLGLSDHTPGHATVLGAVALGARVVEKHFTDDRGREGPDHPFSMDPAGWRDMVNRTRELEAALGGGVKRVADNELETVVAPAALRPTAPRGSGGSGAYARRSGRAASVSRRIHPALRGGPRRRLSRSTRASGRRPPRVDRSRAADLTVLYVSETYTPHDRRFLDAMSRRLGRTAWLCLGRPSSGFEARPVPRGVEVLPATDAEQADPDPERWHRRIAVAAREVAADIVHAGPVPSAAWAAVRSDAPRVVAMAWGSDVLLAAGSGAVAATRVAEALGGAHGFVADARCVVEAAEALGLPPTTPRAVFPWGVEAFALAEPLLKSPMRRRLGWEDAHVCISTRAWKAPYRIDVLLDAFERASRHDPLLRLALLGDGSDAPTVRARSAALVRAGRVVCPGQLAPEQVRGWLEAADLYVSAVPSDGSSISLLEAMAAARPAIVVDRFGNREWVEPGRTGWLVPPADAEVLAATMAAAFAPGVELRAMGRHGREVVLERACWDRNVEQLFALYQEVTTSIAARPMICGSRSP